MTRKEFYRTRLWKDKRIEIIKRDHGICQICKKSAKGYKLKNGQYSQPPVDHILELTDINFTLELALDNENLQTLCHECHNVKTFGISKSINKNLDIDFSKRGQDVEIDLSKLDQYLS
jgi:5-methylcytosine-specific restriction endonuclease McrA